jgi:transposase InsO family protein
MNPQELFEDTWDHYVVQGNPAGYNEATKTCSYLAGCAIGRLMDKKWCEQADAGDAPINCLPDDLVEALLNKFPKIDIFFFTLLQGWHDGYYSRYDKHKLPHQYREVLYAYRRVANRCELNSSFLDRFEPSEDSTNA